MSEHRTVCPYCNRLPGNVHDKECSRSRVSIWRMRAAARDLLFPRPVWLLGPQVMRLPGAGQRITFNPGIPYVDPTNSKPWTAGGVPRKRGDKDKEDVAKFRADIEEVLRRFAAKQRANQVYTYGG